ncbi:leucine-rich repeat protein [Sodaliphilus sp.]|uniref:leucine-rich repeat protein n=1 Tax=Sodaliphilus sp. TaxID=2815818 RepID=UPI0038904631
MKKLSLLLFLAMVSIMASAATGDTFTVGDLNYEVFNEDRNTVDVTGLSAAGKAKSDLALVIPPVVTHNGVRYNVSRIQETAFSNSSNLKSVTFSYNPDSWVIILQGAFAFCTNLTYVRFASSTYSILSTAFIGCSKLKDFYFARTTLPIVYDFLPRNVGMTLYVSKADPNTVERYRANEKFDFIKNIVKSSLAYDFRWEDGALMAWKDNTYNRDLVMVGWDRTAGLVQDRAFVPLCGSGTYGAYGNKYNFVAIADSACLGDTYLKSIDLSQLTRMETIGVSAFSGCTSLSTVVLGSSVKTLLANAFNGCTALTDLTVNAQTPPIAFASCFTTYETTTLRVPAAALSAYKNHAVWGKFLNIKAIGKDGLPGDVNGDDVVDVTDANILINMLLGKDNASNYNGRADVNGDGTVDVSDVNEVLNIMLGK